MNQTLTGDLTTRVWPWHDLCGWLGVKYQVLSKINSSDSSQGRATGLSARRTMTRWCGRGHRPGHGPCNGHCWPFFFFLSAVGRGFGGRGDRCQWLLADLDFQRGPHPAMASLSLTLFAPASLPSYVELFFVSLCCCAFFFFFFRCTEDSFFFFFNNCIIHWDFSHWKFELLSPGKASCDRVALPTYSVLGVLVFP